MKKILTFALAAVLVLGLVACGGSKKNGTYSAQVTESYAEEVGHGWRDQLTVVYVDGKITAATFESIKMDTGEAKSVQTPETYPMTPPVSEWIPELNAQIVNGSVDGVAGATSASESAKAMLEAIEKDGVAGEVIEVQP